MNRNATSMTFFNDDGTPPSKVPSKKVVLSKLDHLHRKHILTAVVRVHDAYETSGLKPGAEAWVTNTRNHRTKLLDDVTEVFCRCSGSDPDWFPYHEDYVCRVWTWFRKLGDWDKSLVREYVNS
jgi:hypothetical protein